MESRRDERGGVGSRENVVDTPGRLRGLSRDPGLPLRPVLGYFRDVRDTGSHFFGNRNVLYLQRSAWWARVDLNHRPRAYQSEIKC